MSTTPDQAVLDRLRHLRNKAEDLLAKDPEHPEGLLFQERYLTLLTKYSLDQAALNTDPATATTAECARYAFPGGAWSVKRAQLISHICSVFDLPHAPVALTDTERFVIITGHRSTIDTATTICDHLLPQLSQFHLHLQASNEYQQHRGHARRSFTSDAMDSWIGRVIGRVATLYRHAKADATPGTDLILADQYDQAANLMQDQINDMTANGAYQSRNLPTLGYRSEQAHRMGNDAADRADIGQTRMGSTAATRAAVNA